MKKLGDILLEAKAVTQAQLDAAIAAMPSHPGKKIGEILVSQGVISSEKIEQFLAQQS